MNTDIIKGKWEEIKGHLKESWGKLTDDDFTRISGFNQELFGKLQQYYGYSKEEAEKRIKEFRDRYGY